MAGTSDSTETSTPLSTNLSADPSTSPRTAQAATSADGTAAPELIALPAGHRLAVRRAGHGGVPLLLVHGFPCTSLIWSRVIGPLADAGFDVAAPDLRGYGDSDLVADDVYDLAVFSIDLAALLDVLGWERAVVVAHDLGASTTLDFANRFPERVERVVLLDATAPDLSEAYAAAGITASGPDRRILFDYQANQGLHADELLDMLNTPERRRRYVGEFFGHRLWSPSDAFSDADREVLTAAYADHDRLRVAFRDYEIVMGRRRTSLPTIEDRGLDQQVMVLIGADAATLGDPRTAEARCEVAYPRLVGPFWIRGAGHFLGWEKPKVVVGAVRSFCADLLAGDGAFTAPARRTSSAGT
ncbi:alpha/beta hydrolase [Catenulispora subtropica]|uniref:Alpha/beta hydrolase n=1 Tax=Catenulispora subtropica TaxID=450798 RepID=A0ABP5E0Z6_9ACTN